jgi:hypothetical protein
MLMTSELRLRAVPSKTSGPGRQEAASWALISAHEIHVLPSPSLLEAVLEQGWQPVGVRGRGHDRD